MPIGSYVHLRGTPAHETEGSAEPHAAAMTLIVRQSRGQRLYPRRPGVRRRYRALDQGRYETLVAGMARTLFDRDTVPGPEPGDLLRLDVTGRQRNAAR